MAQIAVYNNSGSAILAGQVVRQTGFLNPQQLPTIDLASAVSINTANAIGVAAETILDGTSGQVAISGSYSPIDTSIFVPNGKVYLSDTFGEISPIPGTFETVIGYATVVDVMGTISVLCLPPSSSSCPTACFCCGTGGGSGSAGATGIQGATGIGSGGGGGGTGASNTLNMNLLGRFIDAGSLPRTDIGPELTGGVTTYIDFRARRGTPGASGGTTTIELELNGVPTGDTLSWTNADGAWTLKTTVISVAVVSGDRLSFRLTSREGGGTARDIVAEVNA